MKTFIVRDSAGKLWVVLTDGTHPDGVYIQYARDVLGLAEVSPENVDIDVFEVCPTVGTVPLVFEGD